MTTDQVERILGLMGIKPGPSTRLYYSIIPDVRTARDPIERVYIEIPDEWVAKVVDRIAELEAEIAQLKTGKKINYKGRKE